MSGENMKKKLVVLRSKDGEEFEVEQSAAMASSTIKNQIEDDCVDGGITLFEVTGTVLAQVVEYWKSHAAEKATEDELKSFDEEFAARNGEWLFELIMAANYLACQPLIELIAETIAKKIKGMTVEEVREYFGVENDFTPEEEEALRQENAWAFD